MMTTHPENSSIASTAPLLTQLFALNGRSALITGASSGIGQALAIGFAQAGATVGVHGRSRSSVAATCQQIEEGGGVAVPLLADISTVAACRQLIADAAAHLDGLDILVNCAGMNRRKAVTTVTEEDWEAIVDVNLRSAYFLSQAAHPHMVERGGGKIINIGSMTNTYALDGVSVYGATKAGLAQVTRTMALEWAEENIQVNMIAPGFIQTPLTQEGLFQNERRRRWLEARTPMRRPGQPRDLLGAALLLAAPASDYMTGTTITVDGGFLIGGSWDKDAC